MSLYAIGDLHLHFQSDLKNKNQLTSRAWKDHEQKFLKHCRKYLTDRDTLVLVGDQQEKEHADKLVEREAQRLRSSFEIARNAGYRKYIMFLHYPPTNILEKESIFTRIAEEYHAEQVVYAHCHGESRFYDSILGMHNGINYCLVSGDFLKWKPEKILE